VKKNESTPKTPRTSAKSATKAAVKGQKGFTKGTCGNLKGRPPGSLNKTTIFARSLLQGEAESLVRMLIDRAKAGDMAALKICIDRLLPPCRSQPLSLQLPPIETPKDISRAHDFLWAAVGAGELGAQDLNRLTALLDGKLKAIETTDMAEEIERIKALLRSEHEIGQDVERPREH
jgi:hypothetical protein